EGKDFELYIEKILDKNGIQVDGIKLRPGDNGIDFMATFNKQIVIIQCKNVRKPMGINIIKNFQASVSRFAEETLCVIVYNSKKLSNNSKKRSNHHYLTKNAKSWWEKQCPKIKIVNEETIVNCIKEQGRMPHDELYGDHQGVSYNDMSNVIRQKAESIVTNDDMEIDVIVGSEQSGDNYESNNSKSLSTISRASYEISGNNYEYLPTEEDAFRQALTSQAINSEQVYDVQTIESWSCPKCTYKNNLLSLQCEICLNVRPDANQSQRFLPIDSSSPPWDCPVCSFRNESDIVMCIGCEYLKY
ncbi:33772_t:CDS:1, partial [Racocetra persica]